MPRPQRSPITFTIDGRDVVAPEGTMLADAAKAGDVEIPVFCYEPKLGQPVGACRMCLVEVEGIPKLQTACSTPVKDGMVVNPGSCGTSKANAGFNSAQGGSASGSADYTTSGCDGLNWQPDFKIGFSGPASEFAVKGHPTVSTVISQTAGQGNLRAAKVTLPDGIAADLTNVSKRACASADVAAAGGCPAAATIGTADISTSALDHPVKGDVIMVKIPGASLPGLVVHVRDQISLDLVGASKVDSASGRP